MVSFDWNNTVLLYGNFLREGYTAFKTRDITEATWIISHNEIETESHQNAFDNNNNLRNLPHSQPDSLCCVVLCIRSRNNVHDKRGSSCSNINKFVCKSLCLCRTESSISKKHERCSMPMQELVNKSSEYFLALNAVTWEKLEFQNLGS